MSLQRGFFMAMIACLAVFFGVHSGFVAAAEEVSASAVQTEAPEQSEVFQLPVYADDIAAIVNNEIITMTQLMREVSFFVPRIRAESRSQKEFRAKIKECQRFIMNALIEKILIVTDFKDRGGRMPDNFEKKEYDAHIHDRFNDDRVAFTKFLRDNGQSVREFKRDIRERAIVGFVLHELQKTKPEVSPAKIREYYNEHRSEFTRDRQILVKEIVLLKSKYSEEELLEKLAKLNDEISSGENIHLIVENFSDSPKSSEIGWVSADDMIPAFAEAVRDLHNGEFTQPIDLGNKICVLFISAEKPAEKRTLGEARDDIERKLAASYQVQMKENYVKKLKKKAYIKIFL
ncbi:MAG: peptidyl-prolyl cis-trans isomerase [Puniceicoccales bacterium]|jgi:peptidyl-prolyl cis-trans isomerase SurA|nr:peptidyl-prolyl cis-trans isomerase [Puniceicoccales bacterium]